jgi:hypothetical protein
MKFFVSFVVLAAMTSAALAVPRRHHTRGDITELTTDCGEWKNCYLKLFSI